MLVRDKARLVEWLKQNICSENSLVTERDRVWIVTTWNLPTHGPSWITRPEWSALKYHLSQVRFKSTRALALQAAVAWLETQEVTDDGYTQPSLF